MTVEQIVKAEALEDYQHDLMVVRQRKQSAQGDLAVAYWRLEQLIVSSIEALEAGDGSR